MRCAASSRSLRPRSRTQPARNPYRPVCDVCCLTRGVTRIEQHHVGLARAISEVARQHGAVADWGAVHEVQITVAARPDDLDVGFWRAVLGYSTLADDNGVDPLGHGSTFWMRDLDPAKPLRHAMHVDPGGRRPHRRRVRGPPFRSSPTVPATASASPPGRTEPRSTRQRTRCLGPEVGTPRSPRGPDAKPPPIVWITPWVAIRQPVMMDP
jgi:hypothetical protein